VWDSDLQWAGQRIAAEVWISHSDKLLFFFKAPINVCRKVYLVEKERKREERRELRKQTSLNIHRVFFFATNEATQKVYLVPLVDASRDKPRPTRAVSIPTALEFVLLARLGVCIQSSRPFKFKDQPSNAGAALCSAGKRQTCVYWYPMGINITNQSGVVKMQYPSFEMWL
jgi:hypothetical protein